jgi:hypothetical protein
MEEFTMKMKKIISAALAAIMAVSALTTSAFAAGLTGSNTMEAAGVAAIPAIKVTMPKNMSFVINPYKLKVDVKGKVSETGKNTVIVPSYAFTDGATGWEIENTTGAPIRMGVYAWCALPKSEKATFQIIDATGTAVATRKNLKLTIKAGSNTIKLLSAAPTVTEWWSNDAKTAGVTVVDKIEDKAKLAITMSGETANEAKLDWTAEDTGTVNFVFQFGLAEPTS